MADRHLPDAFATDLTGVYATDPHYGANLIAIMRLYNLYQLQTPARSARPAARRIRRVQRRAGRAAGRRHPASARIPAAVGGHGPDGAVEPGRHASAWAAVVNVGGSAGQDTAHADRARHGGSGDDPGRARRVRGGTGRRSAAAARQRRRCWPRRRRRRLARAARARRAPGGRPAARVAPRRPRPSRYVPQIPQDSHDRLRRLGQGAAEPGRAALRRRGQPHRHPLGTAGRLRLDAVPGPAALLAGLRREARHVNAGGTVYRTKSEALAQCAADLVELAMAVYWIDITARRPLSVRELAKVFAAFRWGGLLKLHDISAMEFPYSVEGLTAQHVKMRWPDIKDPNAPDKPGTRFRQPFGAVPVVLEPRLPGHRLASRDQKGEVGPMLRLLILLVGMLTTRRPGRQGRPAAGRHAHGTYGPHEDGRGRATVPVVSCRAAPASRPPRPYRRAGR